jgi:hypothetical protein
MAAAELPLDRGERAGVVRTLLVQLKHEVNARGLEMGSLLLEAKRQGYVKRWGFASLKEFMGRELGIAERTGHYLMEVYKTFIEDLGVSPGDLEEIGWTKAAKLLPVVTDANCARWLTYCRTHTVKEVDVAVHAELGDEDKEQKGMKSAWTVLLTPAQADLVNQAVEAARLEAGSEETGQALEFIAVEFLNGLTADGQSRRDLLASPAGGGRP